MDYATFREEEAGDDSASDEIVLDDDAVDTAAELEMANEAEELA